MSKTDKIVYLVVGLVIGLVIGYWPTISSLWSNRKELSGAEKLLQGARELGIPI